MSATTISRRLTAVLSVAAGIAATAPSAGAQDPLAGQNLAERWCTSCHAVPPDAGGDSGPPFAVIANRPVFEPEALRLFLTRPHPPMPSFSLTRREIDDLVAYLQTLRKKN